MDSNKQEIFFHVGLGKVASTFLQYKVFTRFKGIEYIQRTRYHQIEEILNHTHAPRILISNEFDRQLEFEAKRFLEMFPGSRMIILLRQQHSWIASQYRRFVKNGMYFDFEDFIDLENDKGFWKKEELNFYPKLRFLEKHSGHRPLVLFHEDLKRDTFAFIDRIAEWVGATYSREEISLKPFHTSYKEKELKVLKSLKLYDEPPSRHPNIIIHRLRRYWRFLRCYSVLYPAKLLPKKWVSDRPLIPPEQLEAVKNHYAADWKKCQAYAKGRD